MRKMIIIVSFLILVSCSNNKTQSVLTNITEPDAIVEIIDLPDTIEDKSATDLYDGEFIENKFKELDLKGGYLKVTDDQTSFQEVIFDYDDRPALFVKEYIDDDFVEYDISDGVEIFLIEFEDYTTKYKRVDFEYLFNNFIRYSSRPFYVEITNHKISLIIEKYVP